MNTIIVKWIMLAAWIVFGISYTVGLSFVIISWMELDDEINHKDTK